MSKAEPWNERLWEPVEVLGLSEVHLDTVTISVSAKTMPGKALGVERELRWRIKHALDAAGVHLAPRPAPEDEEEEATDPAARHGRPLGPQQPAVPAVHGDQPDHVAVEDGEVGR